MGHRERMDVGGRSSSHHTPRWTSKSIPCQGYGGLRANGEPFFCSKSLKNLVSRFFARRTRNQSRSSSRSKSESSEEPNPSGAGWAARCDVGPRGASSVRPARVQHVPRGGRADEALVGRRKRTRTPSTCNGPKARLGKGG